VLLWSITTRSTLQQGLYSYDAIARLHDGSLVKSEGGAGAAMPQIGRYIRLGPLGTAMLHAPPDEHGRPRPRVLLIDEIDKSDIDLPNDLLNIFEEGEFDIPELARLPDEERRRAEGVFTYDGEGQAPLPEGRVRCNAFPFVVMTSNGEREFPPAFLRRCLRLDLEPHDPSVLARLVEDRLNPGEKNRGEVEALLDEFVSLRDDRKLELSADQLLNAVYMVMQGIDPLKREELRRAIFRSLSENA
jgi:MoxR-like ATPase